uniref:Uncharacterized protein n=2 Tax=Plectus sambesii TaxID=2011161 RepID=A0A914UG92_9BILA
MIPVSQHKLIKISQPNRRLLTQISLCFSTLACFAIIISSTTNNWLYTSEVLKYFIFPNQSYEVEPSFVEPTYFKNATLGPWLLCWLDPITEFHCQQLEYFSGEEPSDTTTGVEMAVRKSLIFLLFGAFLDGSGIICIFICNMRQNPYKSLLAASLTHIFAGIFNFTCIIVYMSSVSKEISFLCTEMAALFALIVYMAKRDERTYNRYYIRGLFKSRVLSPGISKSRSVDRSSLQTQDRYYEHSRFQSLKKAHRNPSVDESLGEAKKPQLLLATLEEEQEEEGFDHLKSILAETSFIPPGIRVAQSPFKVRKERQENGSGPESTSSSFDAQI